MGPGDVASHAKHGEQSKAAPMFGPPGHAYVYFTYGMHYCFNCVSEAQGSGTGILVRAIEPLDGIELMRERRGPKIDDHNLTYGPAKLCQALDIDKGLNTADLTGQELWLEDGAAPKQVKKSPRVGISRGREDLYRFYDADSLYVSAHPKY
jgi:DNA-3-methyladenine glycosylase